MIRWELRKIIRSKFFIVSLILVVALFMYNIKSFISDDINVINAQNRLFEELYLNQDEYDNYALQYYDVLENFDDITLFQKEGVYLESAWMDKGVIGELINKKEYVAENYEKFISELVKNTAVNIGKSKNQYEKRYYEKSIKIYNTRLNLTAVNEKGMERYLIWIYKEPSIGMILILWGVILIAQAVGFEERKNLKLMVASTKHGRRDMLLSKLISVGLIIAAIKILFVLVYIILGMTLYGISFRMFLAPIQSLEEYKLCSFHISILGYFGLLTLGQLILVEMIICITGVLSYYIKSIPAACISLVVWEIPLYLLWRREWSSYMELKVFGKMKQYVPLCLNKGRDYFLNFEYGRLFNIPINRFVMCLSICLVAMAICIGVVILFAEKVNAYGIRGKKDLQEI